MAGLYIHIPLCESRCAYCDFYSSTDRSIAHALVNGLCQEMELRRSYLKGEAIRTIYLGGGTPSVLPVAEMKRLFDKATELFELNLDEVTVECNPDDVTPEYALALSELPVNRVSMGVQSFNDADLKAINRRHTSQQALLAVDNLRNAGIDNISIDLIYGLPNQTEEGWMHNLQVATSLGVQHISAYSLTYEEGTLLYRQMEQGKVTPVSEELSLLFYQMLCQTLEEHGFEHYEISNFSLPGLAAKHNSSYWDGTPYLGLGPSAHSFNGESRQWNVADTKAYLKGIAVGELNAEVETLTPAEAYNDRVLTSLRTSKGLDLQRLKSDFPQFYDFCLKSAATSLRAGHLELVDDGRTLKLTKDGIFVSDAVFVDLMRV
ncbi:MAG: radical SAM family heme chaperone HemW [Paludibacteraceae bacterium]|nr:radical SAM family heme chaperone HemW [Paludibacteraceae bacterium]